MRAFIVAKQVQFTKTVPNGRLVEVQSSHDIDLDQPELVIKEINRSSRWHSARPAPAEQAFPPHRRLQCSVGRRDDHGMTVRSKRAGYL